VRLDLAATITYEDQDPTKSAMTHVCRYSTLLGSGFRKLPSMGYPLINVETDKEVLLRFAKRFLNHKNVKQLREILSTVDPILDSQEDSASSAERQVFESIKRRAGSVDDELSALARALVESRLIGAQIDQAVRIRVQEYISQQAATLTSEIAAKVAVVNGELETLDRLRAGLEDELDLKRRQAAAKLDLERESFDQWKRAEEARIEGARNDLKQQRDTLSRHLETVISKYKDSKDEIINQFILMAPFLERAGVQPLEGSAKSASTAAAGGDGTPLTMPMFVNDSTGDSDRGDLTEPQFFERFERHVRDCGYSYRRQDLVSFHVSVKCCDISILGGISGTGKSTLPLLYAEALAGASPHPSPNRYLHVGVSPAWLDMRDLLGHVNSLDRRFEPSESGLYRQLIYAQHEWAKQQHESGIYIVTLDEMNLSHVEHYFSGFLQALEHNREIRSFDPSSVDLASTFAQYARIVIPKSIRFVGTVNFDETTKQLSLRLLDRTNLIRLRPMEQTVIFPALTEQRPPVFGAPVRFHHFRDWRRSSPPDREVAALWDRIQQYLSSLGTPITPRRRQAIQEFMASTPPELLSPLQAFDLQICQRLLTQVRGLYRPGAQEALDELERTLGLHPHGFPESLAAISDLRQVEQIGLPFADSTGL
jgi:hypothetical protein